MARKPKTRVIGRDEEFEELSSIFKEFFNGDSTKGKLQIVGISGYGGVGKSFLFERALLDAEADVGIEGFSRAIQIRVDGSNPGLLKDFVSLFHDQFAPRLLPQPAKASYDYFPNCRRLIAKQKKLTGKVLCELEADKNVGEEVKALAKKLYQLRPAVKDLGDRGRLMAAILEICEQSEVEDLLPQALKVIEGLKILSKAPNPFFGLAKSDLKLLRDGAFDAFADAYITDLSAMLSGYRRSDFLKPARRNLKSVDRLLLIVDDFETVGQVAGDFIVSCLLTRLRRARFPTLAIILGRDDLHDSHIDFNQHLESWITSRHRLKPFTEEEGLQLLTEAGYSPKDALDLFKKSRGYPFILRLFADNPDVKARNSALFYQRFYERTTRWMTREQKDWLVQLCYLDEVNEKTIATVLPRQDAKVIMEWFKQEASIRDTESEKFAVEPFISYMLKEHHRRIVGDARAKSQS